MVRALLDANVLISAAIRPSGAPGQVITALLVRRAFELVLSPALVAEVETAFRLPKIRKYLRNPNQARLWLADLVAIADLVPDTGGVVGVCRDPDDDVVLAAAIEGRAAAIVTGDDDLLVLGEYDGIVIVPPRAFVELIKR
jgi:putative PIN family toxin of toxin-antitoxin system